MQSLRSARHPVSVYYTEPISRPPSSIEPIPTSARRGVASLAAASVTIAIVSFAWPSSDPSDQLAVSRGGQTASGTVQFKNSLPSDATLGHPDPEAGRPPRPGFSQLAFKNIDGSGAFDIKGRESTAQLPSETATSKIQVEPKLIRVPTMPSLGLKDRPKALIAVADGRANALASDLNGSNAGPLVRSAGASRLIPRRSPPSRGISAADVPPTTGSPALLETTSLEQTFSTEVDGRADVEPGQLLETKRTPENDVSAQLKSWRDNDGNGIQSSPAVPENVSSQRLSLAASRTAVAESGSAETSLGGSPDLLEENALQSSHDDSLENAQGNSIADEFLSQSRDTDTSLARQALEPFATADRHLHLRAPTFSETAVLPEVTRLLDENAEVLFAPDGVPSQSAGEDKNTFRIATMSVGDGHDHRLPVLQTAQRTGHSTAMVASGLIPLKHSTEGTAVRLGDLIGLLEKKMDRPLFVWLKSSASASKYVTFDTLRAAGISVQYDARTKHVVLSVSAP